MVSQIIEELVSESEDFKIKLIVEDRKGAINLTKKEIKINPVYWEERAETFIHEMLHYYNSEIRGYNYGPSEEQSIELETQSLLKNKSNKEYILNYLNSRI